MKSKINDQQVVIVYDNECPFCRTYSARVRIKANFDDLVLIDARSTDPLVTELKNSGLDLDKGMVVKIDEQLYYGADAVNVLALLSSRSDWFNRLNYCCFRSKRLTHFFYPLLKTGRALALWFLGRSRIR